MAGSVNKVILVGNLGRAPEIRNTQDGMKVVNLSVATSERWKDRMSGEPRERTEVGEAQNRRTAEEDLASHVPGPSGWRFRGIQDFIHFSLCKESCLPPPPHLRFDFLKPRATY